MKRLTLRAFFAAAGLGVLASSHAAFATNITTMPPPEPATIDASYTDAQIDSILAPIALYPDTLLTHILIAATYPLDVVAADRWRQSNAHLSPEEVALALESVSWDPSVKAVAAFSDILNTMAQDLTWLQQLGDNVLINQNRVLARVQVLRQHALDQGNLSSNDYLNVSRDREVIVVAPRRPEVVYVPYYDPVVIYGHWWHPIAPVRWHHRRSYHHHHGIFWSPRVSLSASFYFGGIHWHNRHVVIHRSPVRHYYRGPAHRRVHTREYHRWEHNVGHRRARYSSPVVSRTVRAHRQAPVSQRQVVRTHSEVRTPTLRSREVISTQRAVRTPTAQVRQPQYRQVQPRQSTERTVTRTTRTVTREANRRAPVSVNRSTTHVRSSQPQRSSQPRSAPSPRRSHDTGRQHRQRER